MKHAAGCTAAALATLPVLAALAVPARAGDLSLTDDIDAEYKLTVNYSASMRVKDPDNALVNGPINATSKLPSTINFDDGDRNFKAGSLVNNRISGLAELLVRGPHYGLALSGDGFYDQVYHHPNDNDSPGTVNKSEPPPSRFTDGARYYDGQRVRLLDAYAYGSWPIGDNMNLDVRAGQQLVAWGESLFFSGMAISQSAADATGTIDGLAFDSASNIVSGVLSNITLNLSSAAPNSTETLTVAADTTSAATAVQSFVTAYNAALSLINSATAFTPGSTDSASGTAGPLLGDLAIESVGRQLQSIVGSSAGSATNAFTMLSQIGVTIGSDGTLSVDSDTLNSALQQNPTAVKSMFTGSNGLGTQLDTLLNTVIGAGGTISTKTTALQSQIDGITSQLSALTARQTQLTAQYNAQFNAMDSVVAAYKNTSNLLTQLYAPRTGNSSGSGSS